MIFTSDQITEMQQQLAVAAYHALLRLAVSRDPIIDSPSNARSVLSEYVNANGSKAKDWELHGIKGVFVDRALEFCECTNIPIYRHQLCPSRAVAIMWLEFEQRQIADKKIPVISQRDLIQVSNELSL